LICGSMNIGLGCQVRGRTIAQIRICYIDVSILSTVLLWADAV
jgi:hypothetical protein